MKKEASSQRTRGVAPSGRVAPTVSCGSHLCDTVRLTHSIVGVAVQQDDLGLRHSPIVVAQGNSGSRPNQETAGGTDDFAESGFATLFY